MHSYSRAIASTWPPQVAARHYTTTPFFLSIYLSWFKITAPYAHMGRVTSKSWAAIVQQ
jgi:hypothetical protein